VSDPEPAAFSFSFFFRVHAIGSLSPARSLDVAVILYLIIQRSGHFAGVGQRTSGRSQSVGIPVLTDKVDIAHDPHGIYGRRVAISLQRVLQRAPCARCAASSRTSTCSWIMRGAMLSHRCEEKKKPASASLSWIEKLNAHRGRDLARGNSKEFVDAAGDRATKESRAPTGSSGARGR